MVRTYLCRFGMGMKIFSCYIVARRGISAGGKFRVLPLVRSFFEHLSVALLMGGVCYASYLGLESVLPDTVFVELFGKMAIPLSRGLRVAVLVAEGALLVILLAWLFGLADTTEAVEIFTKKLKKKLRPS